VKAFISGQAGVSVIPGLRPQLRTVHGAAPAPWHTSDALRVFDGCSDVQLVEVPSVDDLDRRTELVPRVVHNVGYNRFSLTRASAVVNCQSALV